ncbi:MAG: hypothetical protein JSS02_30505 [Planctomycetes bacterium]|nr:hypothetical protein [Planctomycetota bacterium]
MYKSLSILISLCVLLPFAGCEHMVENRVVQRFEKSLQEHDLDLMKEETSSTFEEKVAHDEEIFKALKLLDLPEGTPKITSVKNERKEKHGKIVRKRVWCTIGAEQRKVVFMLKPEGDTGRWVIDDFYLSKSDLENDRSVAARLTVLLCVHKSLDAWKTGSREKILATATPEFAQSLSELSPLQLSQFSKKIMANMAETTKILPNERIGDETAELAVAKLEAHLVLSLRRDGQRWKLDDLAVKARRTGDDIASARLTAGAMSAALRFADAYRRADKESLQAVCTPRFYAGCLADSDVTTVKLPESGPGLDAFDIKLEEKTATFVLPAGNEWLKISLALQPLEQLHAAPKFLVDEVTIYDQAQDKRLSALFTAQDTLEAFCAAYVRRDLKGIKNNSTYDFNERVWERATDEFLQGLPTTEYSHHRPKVSQMRFEGSLTEIMVEHGDIPVTYRLRDENGRILVDDVLTPSNDWPNSLKATGEVLMPLLCFRDALRNSRIALVRSNCSREFAKHAWNHFDTVPRFDIDLEGYFGAPLVRISRKDDRAKIVYGDDSYGALVDIVKDQGQFVVDEVVFISGSGENQRIALKKTLRSQLSNGEISTSTVPLLSNGAGGGVFTEDEMGSNRPGK